MKYFLSVLLLLSTFLTCFSQEPEVRELTREKLLEMSIEDLADLSFEELIQAMELLGVSSMEELIELLINRNVYSASRRTESTMVSPLSSSVLSREEIQDYGATTIEEALRLIPGVIVRQKTNGNFDVHLRGLDNLPSNNLLVYSENTNTLLMIDGRPMFNYAHGAIVWETLPIGFEDIDRIEVVRGPASALYGSNAVNGVINIITSKDYKDVPLVSGSLQGGTLNSYMGNLAFRKTINNRLSAAVTTNFQSRERDTEEVYFFDLGNMYLKTGEDTYTEFNGGFLPVNEYQNLRQLYNDHYYHLLTDDIDNLFPNVGLARENLGINAYLQYDIAENTNLDVSGGYQNSYVNSSPVGDIPRALAGRKSSTAYVNMIASIGDLRLQSNYMGGVQDFSTGEAGFKVDMGQLNINTEYDININSLNIRPGVSYQSVFYDDTPHLQENQSGYLNERKELNTIGASLRLDYILFDKLRLVAALRSEKYNYPDKWYTSWQFAGTLPINENQTLRAVYSRANRSSFIVNAHSDYTWDRTGRTPPNYILFKGTPDAKLMQSDMVELGYRIRPNNRILLDIELFASQSKDFGALMTEKSELDFSGLLSGTAAAPETWVYISYLNLPLEAQQVGVGFNLDWIISEKLITRFHGTVQETKLDNYSALNRNQITERQLGQEIPMQIGAIIQSYNNPNINSVETLLDAILTGLVEPTPELFDLMSDWQPTEFEDGVIHQSTPSYWGMIGVIYRPIKKLTIAADSYIYGSQTFLNINGQYNIDSKVILNTQIAYKATDNIEVFFNARNLLNDKSVESAFMDNTGALYLGGLRFTF